MNCEVEETGPVERRLRIEVTTSEVDAAFEAVYRELGRAAKLRGFRPGKAPKAVLQRAFGSQARGEVLERVVRDTLPKAIADSKLPVVGEPRLLPESEPKEGAPFVYEVTVDIRPEIELVKVRGLEATPEPLPEPEGEQDPVERYLEDLRNSQAQLVTEEAGVQAARGHIAQFDYEGSVGGEPLPNGSGKGNQLEIGSSGAIAGFEENLEGMLAGTEREFDVELPGDFPDEELRGQTAHFHVTLQELKRKELPELDDEFAKDVSEFETLEELRSDLRERIEQGRERQRKQLEREAVVNALVLANPFPVPESLIERELNSRIGRVLNQLRGALPPEQMQEQIERMREDWRPQAESAVRLALLVPEIAASEGIEISDDDVDARLAEIAEQQGKPLAEIRRSFADSGMTEALRAGLLEERVVEFATSEATLSGV
jgi:trigger factor